MVSRSKKVEVARDFLFKAENPFDFYSNVLVV